MSGLRVTVIGAGLVGVALASSLVRRGCRVTVIAPSRQTDGATGTSYEWLNSHRKRPDAYQTLNQLGLAHWHDSFGPKHADRVIWSGHTAIAVSDEHRDLLANRVEYLAARGYAAELAGADHVDLGVRVPGEALIARFSTEGYCDAIGIRNDLLADLNASAGFEFIEDTVDSVDGSAVILRSGSHITADRAIIAAGNGSPALIRSAGALFAMADQTDGGPAWGFLATVAAPGHGVRELLTTDETNLRPIDEDTLLVQCLDLDRLAGATVTEPLATVGSAFSARVSSLLGRTAETTKVRVGHRVIPGDGMTAAGPLFGAPCDSVWAVVTHSGITLGPWLAEVIADEIVAQKLDARLAEFRPTRFAGNTVRQVVAPRRPGDQ